MKNMNYQSILMLTTLSIVASMPTELTTTKSTTLTTTTRLPTTTTTTATVKIGETVKQLTNQLLDLNTTTDLVALDTRTPPRVQQQITKNQKLKHHENFENSYAGIAIPLNEDDINLDEEATKKLNFYKIEKLPTTTTTTSGLSTWVFLSGQTTSTIKPPKKPIIKPINETHNHTLIETNMKTIKPLFKKRVTTTRKPFSPKSTRSTTITPSSATPTTTTTIATTPKSKETTKLTKIKASILNNAVNKKNQSITHNNTSTTTVTPSVTTKLENSTILPIQAKDGDTDLLKAEEKQTKRPSTKRKKNKNRRRRPSTNKNDNNSTKIEKHKNKTKPASTQLYNYLSRQVVPTVSIGLVGLMAAAGLTYFFYPFAVARRSYELDRRVDNNNNYYYDDYSTGIAEEEAIGKVIAGMPENTLFGNTYKQPTSRNTLRYQQQQQQQQVDHRILQGNNQNNYNHQEFVVGNIPTTITSTTEDVTPVSVPEHGPRSLTLRKRRSIEEIDDKENEIGTDFDSSTIPTSKTPTTTPISVDKTKTFFDLIAELLRLKINLGLALLQNATQTVSRYVSHVQRRLDEHYNNSTNQ